LDAVRAPAKGVAYTEDGSTPNFVTYYDPAAPLADVAWVRRSLDRSLQLGSICRLHVVARQAASQLLADCFLDPFTPNRASVAAGERKPCGRALASRRVARVVTARAARVGSDLAVHGASAASTAQHRGQRVVVPRPGLVRVAAIGMQPMTVSAHGCSARSSSPSTPRHCRSGASGSWPRRAARGVSSSSR